LTVSSADDNMGSAAVTSYPCNNNLASIAATPGSGYMFDHSSDSITDNPRTLTLTQDTDLVAYFVDYVAYNVVVNNGVGGGTYTAGSTAMIFALPQVDMQFAGWSDSITDNPRYIAVTSDTTLTALSRAPDTVINIVYDTTYVYSTIYVKRLQSHDTSILIHMELAGDSLFTQEGQSMVVTHPDSTYIKLRFDVEPTAERVEVLDQGQHVVATFLNATEEHVFRLTTGLYTIRAVFPGGATFEGTIDFVNELQE
jgi:hypothetical protein